MNFKNKSLTELKELYIQLTNSIEALKDNRDIFCQSTHKKLLSKYLEARIEVKYEILTRQL